MLMTPRALKAKAVEDGIAQEIIDGADDEDDVKGALIDMHVKHQEEEQAAAAAASGELLPLGATAAIASGP
jgi:hypothetical protein